MRRSAVEPTRPEARLRAVVRGRVQGVGFRYYAVREARRLGLWGWVANRWDGSVETVAEGDRPALERFQSCLERGPPSSYVDRVEVSWSNQPTGEFDTFGVRYL
jgi:acylphosphatase